MLKISLHSHQELSSDTPLPQRLRLLKELADVVEKRILEPVSTTAQHVISIFIHSNYQL